MNSKQRFQRDPGPATVPDAELVQRIHQGDDAACELLVRRFNQRLFRVARGIVSDDAEAEDVVQESYLRAFSRLHQFSGPHGLGAWLAKIVVNEALGRLRRHRRLVFLDDHLGGDDETSSTMRASAVRAMTSPGPGPEQLAASGELGRILERAVDQLPDPYRSVFMMRAVEGMSIAETAESLSIPPETVKTRLHRARRIMQRSLSGQLEGQLSGAFAFDGARCDRMVNAVMGRLRAQPGWSR